MSHIGPTIVFVTKKTSFYILATCVDGQEWDGLHVV